MFENFGNHLTLWWATAVNVVVALSAFRLAKSMPEAQPSETADETETGPAVNQMFVLAAAGLVGFAFFLNGDRFGTECWVRCLADRHFFWFNSRDGAAWNWIGWRDLCPFRTKEICVASFVCVDVCSRSVFYRAALCDRRSDRSHGDAFTSAWDAWILRTCRGVVRHLFDRRFSAGIYFGNSISFAGGSAR